MKASAPIRRALRVALAATIAVAICYFAIVAVIVLFVSKNLLHETSAHVDAQLSNAQRFTGSELSSRDSVLHDVDDPPVYLWQVNAANAVTAASADAPQLPAGIVTHLSALPRTASIDGRKFLFSSMKRQDGSQLIAAESLLQQSHVRSVLLTSALAVSPFLLAGVFVCAFIIGRAASKPLERARLRQLEFTADASHELRTPLTVVEAEVGLALATNRTAGGYRDALVRVSGETQRLRRIVEDMMWLARFDSHPPAPQAAIVDVTTVARQCADRFAPVVQSRNLDLTVSLTGLDLAHVAAAPEWVDRLIGVLLDNATRYANSPGRIVVTVACTASHVALTVADDGPGIPLAERARLFDRFHRIDETGSEGAGLGLAIADAIVCSTHGRWTVGDSELGGARMTVTWPRYRSGALPRLVSPRL
ncbi:MAG TPA: HAMP domain-containing sensor histidine kinase [Acidothermaceae bacterium]